MSRWLSWIFLTPVALVVIAFSVSNRSTVVLNLWPLDVSSPPLPIFGVVLASIFVGVILGSVVSWLNAGKLRARVRDLANRAERAEREADRLRQEVDNLETAKKDERISLAAPSNTRAA